MSLTDMFGRVLSIGGIAGVIALIIAGAIAGRYFMHGPEQVPDILSNALTTILGFYFGAGVTTAAAAARDRLAPAEAAAAEAAAAEAAAAKAAAAEAAAAKAAAAKAAAAAHDKA
jgi:hypothetical protein